MSLINWFLLLIEIIPDEQTLFEKANLNKNKKVVAIIIHNRDFI